MAVDGRVSVREAGVCTGGSVDNVPTKISKQTGASERKSAHSGKRFV